MTEEKKELVENAPQSAPQISLRKAFLVPNLINLAAVTLVLAVVLMLLFAPIMQVSQGKSGRTAEVSTMDMILDMDKEASSGASALESAGNGDFSQAVQMLGLRLASQKSSHSLLNSHLNLILTSFIWYGAGALLALVILAVMFFVLLFQAVMRFLRCSPNPKVGESYVALLAPLLLVVVPKLAAWILNILGMGEPIRYVHLHTGSMLLLTGLAVMALGLDILCYALSQQISKKVLENEK